MTYKPDDIVKHCPVCCSLAITSEPTEKEFEQYNWCDSCEFDWYSDSYTDLSHSETGGNYDH